MSQRDEFTEWSEKWDAIFKLCERGKISWLTLLEHTLQYKKRWNFYA